MRIVKPFALCGALLAASAIAHADAEDSSAAAGSLTEVAVTATKLNTTQRNMPQASEIVTQAQILAQAQTSVTDVLRQQPGIQFQVGGAPGQFIYPRLRGFTDSTLYVFDGITLNTGGSGDIGYLLGQLDPNMVQSIQVLRGPRATTYGANTTSGVLVFTTLQATGRQADVSAEGGSLDWRKVRVGLQDQESVADGMWSGSLNGSYVRSGGEWQYEYTKSATVVGRTSFKNDSFEVGLSFYLNDNRFQSAALDEYYPGYSGGNFTVQIPDPSDVDRTRDGIGSLWFEQQLTSNLSQRLTVGYAGQDFSINEGQVGSDGLLGYYTAPYDGFSDPNSGATFNAGEQVAVYQFPFTYKTINDNTQADYNLRYRTDTVSAVLGATYLEQIFNSESSYAASTKESQQVRSIYADASIGWLDNQLHTELGARLDSYSAWKNEATYSVGVTYDILHDLTFYANYGTSFTQPTLAQLYDPIYGNKSITPENASTIEAGFRARQWDGQLSENVTFWHSYVSNVVTFDSTIPNSRIPPTSGAPFGEYANEKAERSQGVEFEAAYQITPQLSVSGNYTRTDAYTVQGGIWTYQIENARNMGNLGLTWTQPQFDAGTNLFMTDHRRDYSGQFWAPGYARLDFFGRYHVTGHFDLYARVQNALDHHIVEIIGYKNPGVYAIGGASYRFD